MHQLTFSSVDPAGNQEQHKSLTIRVDSTPPSLRVAPDQTVQQTLADGAIVSYQPPAIVETGSGVAASSCLPASGSVFPVGAKTVKCTATDVAGNAGSAAFTVTVTPAPDGRIYGMGYIDQGGKHNHFVFRVAQLHNQDYGRLEFWVNDSRRCPESDDDDRGRNSDGDHDGNYGRDHSGRASRFEATNIASVAFSNDPGFLPGRGRPSVDTVRFSGTGKWNGRTGYTFEAFATDQGEPGRRRDTFSLVVRDARGNVVADINGTLSGGNIQSTRLRR